MKQIKQCMKAKHEIPILRCTSNDNDMGSFEKQQWFAFQNELHVACSM